MITIDSNVFNSLNICVEQIAVTPSHTSWSLQQTNRMHFALDVTVTVAPTSCTISSFRIYYFVFEYICETCVEYCVTSRLLASILLLLLIRKVRIVLGAVKRFVLFFFVAFFICLCCYSKKIIDCLYVHIYYAQIHISIFCARAKTMLKLLLPGSTNKSARVAKIYQIF